MLSFTLYALPLSDYQAQTAQLAAGKISPLDYQNLMARYLVVSGYDHETAAYLTGLAESGWTGGIVQLNAYTRCFAVQSGLVEAVLHERVAFVEANLLPDIRKINKNLLAQAGRAAEWTAVLVEEN